MSRSVQPGSVLIGPLSSRPLRPGRLRRFSAEHPLLFDTALAVVLVGVLVILIFTGPRDGDKEVPDWWVLATVVAGVLVSLRRTHPPIILALATGATAVFLFVSDSHVIVFVATLICAFTVASTGNRRLALAAGAGSAAVLFITAAIAMPGWLSGENISMVAWMGMAVAAGDAMRSRREYVSAIEERALRAEQSREQEARRQVAEERLRIARELHDVVAHHMAMITVQSGVAAHLLRSQPDGAERALTIVRESGRSVLQEMTGMLNVLRRPEDPDELLEPLPNLQQLGDLVESFAAAGLHVEWRSIGTPAAMVASVQLTIYRVVQESLTNANKYGDGSARLCVSYTAEAVGIDVENRVGRDAADGFAGTGGGLGLIGMRERVTTLGGTITAGRREPGLFCVSASIPVDGGGR